MGVITVLALLVGIIVFSAWVVDRGRMNRHNDRT